jgi:hypothetical protein
LKKSLLTLGIATLLASGSTALLASSVTIPNTFESGTPAVASDVNDNFTAVADAVNDNDSRVTTNTTGVATNTGEIAINASDITTNGDNITTNGDNITTNGDNIQTNTDDIAALQSGASCSDDMVAVGSLCVDLYESSVWDNPAGTGDQLNTSNDDILCNNNGNNCGASETNPIYALSQAGPTSVLITWYQAAQACANVGKRLPTIAEWQVAAQGTPETTTSACNAPAAGGSVRDTGFDTACVSSTGAFDMVGNVWEWVADVTPDIIVGNTFNTTDNATGYALGESYNDNASGLTPSPRVVFERDNSGDPDLGLNTSIATVGFRCVR